MSLARSGHARLDSGCVDSCVARLSLWESGSRSLDFQESKVKFQLHDPSIQFRGHLDTLIGPPKGLLRSSFSNMFSYPHKNFVGLETLKLKHTQCTVCVVMLHCKHELYLNCCVKTLASIVPSFSNSWGEPGNETIKTLPKPLNILCFQVYNITSQGLMGMYTWQRSRQQSWRTTKSS